RDGESVLARFLSKQGLCRKKLELLHGSIIIEANGSGFTSFPKDDALAGAGAAIATVPGPVAGAHPGVESNGCTGTPTKHHAGRVGDHRDVAGGEGKPRNRRSRGGRSGRRG